MDAYKSRQVSLCVAKHCRGERGEGEQWFLAALYSYPPNRPLPASLRAW